MSLTNDLYRDDVIAYFLSYIQCDGFALESLFFNTPQYRSERLGKMIERDKIKRKLISYKFQKERCRRYFYFIDEHSPYFIKYNLLALSYHYVLRNYGTIKRFEPKLEIYNDKESDLTARCVIQQDEQEKVFYIEIDTMYENFIDKIPRYEAIYKEEPFTILYFKESEIKLATPVPINFITIKKLKDVEKCHYWENEESNGQNTLNDNQIEYLDQIVDSLRPMDTGEALFKNYNPYRIYRFTSIYSKSTDILKHLSNPNYENAELVLDVETKNELKEAFAEYSYSTVSSSDEEFVITYYVATYHSSRIDRITDKLEIVDGNIIPEVIFRSSCKMEVIQNGQVIKEFIDLLELIVYLKQREEMKLSVNICNIPISISTIKKYKI